MPEETAQLKEKSLIRLTDFFTHGLPSVLLASIIFFGGIALLALKIPGWSLFLGLPSVQVGIVFLIFTFDNLAKARMGKQSLHMVPCSICKKLTLAPLWQKERICRNCQKKIGQKLKKEI